MPNEGFKGDRVHVENLSIAAGPSGTPVLVVGVQFVSEDGVVHAIAKHSFMLDAEVATDSLAAVAAELMRLVTKKVELAHFTRPSDASTPLVQGIAETLRDRPPDEPGTQG